MTNFSDVYINSPLVKSMLEGIPESERAIFLDQLRKNISAYDGLVGPSSVFDLLMGPVEEISAQDGRRPPRRN